MDTNNSSPTTTTATAEDLRVLGNKAYDQKQYELAVQYFSRGIELLVRESNSSWSSPSGILHILYSNRSISYWYLGRFWDALNDANKVIEIKPDWIKGYIRKGRALISLGEYHSAKDVLEKGLKLEPRNVDLLALLKSANEKQQQQQQQQKQQQKQRPATTSNVASTPTPVPAASTPATESTKRSSTTNNNNNCIGSTTNNNNNNCNAKINNDNTTSKTNSTNPSASKSHKAKKCANCGVVQDHMKKCSSCRSVHYCSEACQRQHWSIHRPECKQIQSNNQAPISLSTKRRKARGGAAAGAISSGGTAAAADAAAAHHRYQFKYPHLIIPLYQFTLYIDHAHLQAILNVGRQPQKQQQQNGVTTATTASSNNNNTTTNARDDIIADLEHMLERLPNIRDPERTVAAHAFVMHAVFLLADLGATRSYQKILDNVFTLDENTLDFYLGDMLTEHIWIVTCKLCTTDENLAAAERFMRDPANNMYARTSVSTGLAQLALHRPELRPKIIELFRRLLELFDSEEGDELFADIIDEEGYYGLVLSDLVDMGAKELKREIRRGFRESGRFAKSDVISEEEALQLNRPEIHETMSIFEIYERYKR